MSLLEGLWYWYNQWHGMIDCLVLPLSTNVFFFLNMNSGLLRKILWLCLLLSFINYELTVFNVQKIMKQTYTDNKTIRYTLRFSNIYNSVKLIFCRNTSWQCILLLCNVKKKSHVKYSLIKHVGYHNSLMCSLYVYLLYSFDEDRPRKPFTNT